MEHLVYNLGNDELKLLYHELLNYIIGSLKYGMQKTLADQLGENFSSSQLSQYKSIEKWDKKNKDFLKMFLDRMDIKVTFDIGYFNFTGGEKYQKDDEKSKVSENPFFGTPKGNKWIVFSHLISSNKIDVNEIQKRLLIIEPAGVARYIIKSKTHTDYTGNWRYSNDGGYLIFDLQTELKLKDLHIRFSVIGKDCVPDIMLGVLIHSLAKENSIACHRIIAINSSEYQDEETPASIPFEEFKETNQTLAAYFESGSSMLSSPHGIITLDQLSRHNKKIKAKQ